ncbi:hypothetical protein J6590_022633 [Homalodisca vitripennis]|nr:hypothetical protein J6590_022633 [Homalodisca vitripennis]
MSGGVRGKAGNGQVGSSGAARRCVRTVSTESLGTNRKGWRTNQLQTKEKMKKPYPAPETTTSVVDYTRPFRQKGKYCEKFRRDNQMRRLRSLYQSSGKTSLPRSPVERFNKMDTGLYTVTSRENSAKPRRADPSLFCSPLLPPRTFNSATLTFA